MNRSRNKYINELFFFGIFLTGNSLRSVTAVNHEELTKNEEKKR
jgi:hypothetical protein